MSCARPFDTASRVTNSAYTRTGVLGTQYLHSGAEPDALGSAGDRGQHHSTCGVHEILADSVGIDS
jgi:hypothetical protein